MVALYFSELMMSTMEPNQSENDRSSPPETLTLNDLAKIMNDSKREIINKVDQINNEVSEVKLDVCELKDKIQRQELINNDVSN